MWAERRVSKCEIKRCVLEKYRLYFVEHRLIVNAAFVPARTVTMLDGMSLKSGRTSHVWRLFVTEAMQWCEQIKQCLYWLLIQQHVSTGTQIYAVMLDCLVPTFCNVRTTLCGSALVKLL